jgi:hypothetical protein
LKDTGPVVRFAARAQQPAALNDVIEATTSEFGTKRTSSDVRSLVAIGRNADIAVAGFDVLL